MEQRPTNYTISAAPLSKLAQVGVGLLTAVTLIACAGTDDDAPPTLPALLEAPCALEATNYLIDEIELPLTPSGSQQLALDLDFDDFGRPDNAGGQTLAFLMAQHPGSRVELRESVQNSLDSGRVRWVVQVQTCAGQEVRDGDYARVAVHRATDVDGDGVMEIVGDGAIAAVGQVTADGVVAAEGTGEVPVSALVDIVGMPGPVTWVGGDGLALDLSRDTDDSLRGVLGAGLRWDFLDAIADPIAALYSAKLEDGGSEFAAALDADRDGRITPLEFARNPAVRALAIFDLNLFATVEGEAVYWPGAGQENDRLSIGIGIHATRVEVEQAPGSSTTPAGELL